MTGKKQKHSAKQMRTLLEAQHQNIHDAVRNVLEQAGIHGVDLHSMKLNVSPEAIDGSPCDPPCTSGQTCKVVLDPGGFHWECE